VTTRRRLATWSTVALAVLLGATSAVFIALGPGRAGVVEALFLGLPGVAFTVVGVLMALRRPENTVGRLCLAIGVLWLVVGTSDAVATWAALVGEFRLAGVASVLGSCWVPALGLMATHLPLRLPDGALVSPSWRWYSRFCTAVIVVISIGITTEPGLVADVPGTQNPLAADLSAALGPLFVLFPLSFVGAIASLVLRYRRSTGIARRQIRVVAFGAAVFVTVYLLTLVPQLTLAPDHPWLEGVLSAVTLVAYTAIPAAIGVAVFRYRLYDIDVVVNRTLVYGSLTATLVAAYLGSVFTLQFALSPLTDESDLAVAGSTLAAAALFRPARTRIQALVDRRFYRRRYDAARTLQAFTGRLREQVDIEALRGDLYGVVRDTVQPTHVSLWLRGVSS